MKAKGKILEAIIHVSIRMKGVDRVFYNEDGNCWYTDREFTDYNFLTSDLSDFDMDLIESASDEAFLMNGSDPSVFTYG